jgi:protein MpaA
MEKEPSLHNFKALSARWRYLAQRSELTLTQLCQLDDFPIFKFSNHPIIQSRKGLYISSGIHGDEPASCWGLLKWAESNISLIQNIPVMLFPCLNPWGLINNSRLDKRGCDLNRVWENQAHPLVLQILRALEGFSVSLSLNLHEDYDANGVYLYEPYNGGKNDSFAEQILISANEILPVDSRKKIEGRRCKHGVIRPRTRNLPKEGMPEALYLNQEYGSRNFTLETPSEEACNKRISSHEKMISKAVHLVFN